MQSEYLSKNSEKDSVISEERDLATSIEIDQSSPELMKYNDSSEFIEEEEKQDGLSAERRRSSLVDSEQEEQPLEL